MSSLAITDRFLLWLSSNLTQRSQVVSSAGATNNHRPAASGVIQRSGLSCLLFFTCTVGALNSISHSVPCLLMTLKICPLKSNDVGFAAKEIFSVFLDHWCSSCMMSFSTENSQILTFRFTLSKGSALLPRSPTAGRPTISDLVLNYLASQNFSEHVVLRSAKSRPSISRMFRIMKLFDSILSNYKWYYDFSDRFRRTKTVKMG